MCVRPEQFIREIVNGETDWPAEVKNFQMLEFCTIKSYTADIRWQTPFSEEKPAIINKNKNPVHVK